MAGCFAGAVFAILVGAFFMWKGEHFIGGFFLMLGISCAVAIALMMKGGAR